MKPYTLDNLIKHQTTPDLVLMRENVRRIKTEGRHRCSVCAMLGSGLYDVRDIIPGMMYVCDSCVNYRLLLCFHCDTIMSAFATRSFYVAAIEDVTTNEPIQNRGIWRIVLCRTCYLGCDKVHCEHCGKSYIPELIIYSEEHDGKYCYECIKTLNEKVMSINDYGHKPRPKFKVVDGEKVSASVPIGIEVEVDSPENYQIDRRSIATHVIKEMDGLVYCKEDGSLNYGFEMVSHPMSEKYFNRVASEKYKKVFKYLSENGMQSFHAGTCGIHIHIAKDRFTTLHLHRFMRMFYENKAFILLISQRKQRQLEQWAKLSLDNKAVERYAKRKLSSDRYQAVNLTENTAEVRVFRGTLSHASFCKNVEFIYSLYEYTRVTNSNRLSLVGFLNWLSGTSGSYKNLKAYLTRKKEVLNKIINTNQ